MEMVVRLATLFAVLLAVFQLGQLRKQRHRDFEDLFMQRYWGVMERLSPQAIEGTAPADGYLSDTDRAAVLAYLHLVEDELNLRAENWIRRDTWRIWRAGMASQLRRWPFSEVYVDVLAQEAARGDYGQLPHLRRTFDRLADVTFDPCMANWLARRFRGR